MPSRPLHLRQLLPLAIAFLCLHAISMEVFRAKATLATYPFIILAPSLAFLACCRRAQIASSRVRLSWMLFSAGLFLWTTGMLLSAWEELFQHVSSTIAFFSDFIYFLYAVPILLAISSPTKEQRIPLFVWLDGIQAVLTAYLTYITLFAVVPFTTRVLHPISDFHLVLVYNVENLVLAGAATLRLITQPRQSEQRHFFFTLSSFLWIYAVCAAIYNYEFTVTNAHTLVDTLVSIPFLYLAITTLLATAPQEEATPIASKQRPITLFLDNFSPIFYPLALVALGIAVLRSHFYAGIIPIIVALAVYGIRTTLLQNRYLQSQQELQEARDRLEEMSLKDGLTNVANRRRFDQFLELEWNRATRNQTPLSLLLIDLDHFKNMNDRYGHRYGDHCLIRIAATLQSVLLRSSDLIARYGGEEFAVVLPATDMNGANSVANRMLNAVRALNLPNQTPDGDFASISIGIAVYQFPHAGSPATLVEASDRALYAAKQNGRNRIECSSMHATSTHISPIEDRDTFTTDTTNFHEPWIH